MVTTAPDPLSSPRPAPRATLGWLIALSSWLTFTSGCASIDIVRLQPDQLRTPKGTEPIAGIQATCLGFYFFTLGLPQADLDLAVNELLMKEAMRIGADRVINLRFDATPSGGIWWLTKLFFFRSATAWGVAIRGEPNGEENEKPPPIPLPPAPRGKAPPAATKAPPPKAPPAATQPASN